MPLLKPLGATMGKVSGKSPEHASLVYSQEPAAQMVAQVAQQSWYEGLGLGCCTRGQISSTGNYLAGEGLLVLMKFQASRLGTVEACGAFWSDKCRSDQ